MDKLTRRHVSLMAALLAAAPARLLAAPAASLRDQTKALWLYGLPLIEMAQVRARRQAPINLLVHARRLSGPEATNVTTPNNDTLYSTAWLDLRGGPVTLTLPAAGQRYMSVAFMDMYTNNFRVLGGRELARSQGGTWTIALAGAATPKGANVITSPTPYVWMLGRTLAASEADLAAVHALQDKMVLTARPPTAQPFTGGKRDDAAGPYFAAVQALINENPPPAADQPFWAANGALEVTPGGSFSLEGFSAQQLAEIKAGMADGYAEARKAAFQGSVGDFGVDYLNRARIALGGLGALPRTEAIYINLAGPGAPLAGGKAYRLSFTKDHLPPADAFWSLSLYRITDQGQMFFAENPIHRYAIGDRTPGLSWRPDGGLDLWIGADPGPDKQSNWLPSPPSGPIGLVLRGYLPKPAMLSGRYKPPMLVAI